MRNSGLELSGSSGGGGVERSSDSGHVLKGEGGEFVDNLLRIWGVKKSSQRLL